MNSIFDEGRDFQITWNGKTGMVGSVKNFIPSCLSSYNEPHQQFYFLKPYTVSSIYIERRRLLSALQGYNYGTQSDGYSFSQGLITDSNSNILLLATRKKNMERYSQSPDDFRLYVSPKLIENKSLYTLLFKRVILPVIQSGVTVIFHNNIKSLFFDSIIVPTFTTLTQRIEWEEGLIELAKVDTNPPAVATTVDIPNGSIGVIRDDEIVTATINGGSPFTGVYSQNEQGTPIVTVDLRYSDEELEQAVPISSFGGGRRR